MRPWVQSSLQKQKEIIQAWPCILLPAIKYLSILNPEANRVTLMLEDTPLKTFARKEFFSNFYYYTHNAYKYLNTIQ